MAHARLTLELTTPIADALQRLSASLGESPEVILAEAIVAMAFTEVTLPDYAHRRAVLQAYARGDIGSEDALDAIGAEDLIHLNYLMAIYTPEEKSMPQTSTPLLDRLHDVLNPSRGSE